MVNNLANAKDVGYSFVVVRHLFLESILLVQSYTGKAINYRSGFGGGGVMILHL